MDFRHHTVFVRVTLTAMGRMTAWPVGEPVCFSPWVALTDPPFGSSSPTWSRLTWWAYMPHNLSTTSTRTASLTSWPSTEVRRMSEADSVDFRHEFYILFQGTNCLILAWKRTCSAGWCCLMDGMAQYWAGCRLLTERRSTTRLRSSTVSTGTSTSYSALGVAQLRARCTSSAFRTSTGEGSTK